MAMRRISWIDQRVRGGVVMLWLFPGTTFCFFGRWRISAMPDRGHHGEGEHHQGHVAVPAMPGSALVVIEPELVFRGFKAVLDRPSMAFDRDQRSMDVPAGHQVVKKARSSSAMRQRISRPRVHKPSFALLNCSGLEMADSSRHQSCSPVRWFRLPPTGASSR